MKIINKYSRNIIIESIPIGGMLCTLNGRREISFIIIKREENKYEVLRIDPISHTSYSICSYSATDIKGVIRSYKQEERLALLDCSLEKKKVVRMLKGN